MSTTNRGVRAALWAAALNKSVALVLQVVAVPLAVGALGIERFGIFLMLYGLAGWATLGNAGLGQALGQLLPRTGNDDGRKSELIGTAILLSSCGSFAILCGGILLAYSGVPDLFFPGVPPKLSNEISASLLVMLVLLSAHSMLATIEGAQIALLRSHVVIGFRLAGTVFAILSLFYAATLSPHIAAFVVALVGGPLLASFLHAIYFAKAPSTKTYRLTNFALLHVRVLVYQGCAFLAISAASFITGHLCVAVLGFLTSPTEVVEFGLFIRLLVVAVSVVSVLTQPLLPAIVHAHEGRDNYWLQRSLKRAFWFCLSIAILFAVAIGIGGSRILELWTGQPVHAPPVFNFLFGIYGLLVVLSHLAGTILAGMGHVGRLAAVTVIEAILMIVLGTALTLIAGREGMIVGMLLALTLCSGSLYLGFLLPLLTPLLKQAARPS